MAEQSPEMLAALQSLLAQAQQPAPASGGWAQPQAAALPITGISIPVKVDTPLGSVRLYLNLQAECGQSPQAIMGAIQALVNAGYPVDAWQKKESGWGGGGDSGNGGSWGNRGGGSYGGSGGGGWNRGGGGFGRRW